MGATMSSGDFSSDDSSSDDEPITYMSKAQSNTVKAMCWNIEGRMLEDDDDIADDVPDNPHVTLAIAAARAIYGPNVTNPPPVSVTSVQQGEDESEGDGEVEMEDGDCEEEDEDSEEEGNGDGDEEEEEEMDMENSSGESDES